MYYHQALNTNQSQTFVNTINTERVRCQTQHYKENSKSFLYQQPIQQQQQNLNEQLLIQNQKLSDQNVRLQNECKRLEYHLNLIQQNFQQLKQLYDQDQLEMQRITHFCHQQQQEHNSMQTRILDLEQENFQLHHEIDHYKKNLKDQEFIENQRREIMIGQQKLIELQEEMKKEVEQIKHDPLMEILESWRDRALKSCSYNSQQQPMQKFNTTKEKYQKLTRLTMQAAELLSFKLNYK
ncbi:unnamed protein product [Paramecium pentaurelia]|uniref:Uncharacterized protein n=1 Tax=Paramecium pentaurelia TaxID=43138 RepID=A0A8S1SGG8_9CILI|nr:unnamed protein product [Paramecium pentaurelia]